MHNLNRHITSPTPVLCSRISPPIFLCRLATLAFPARHEQAPLLITLTDSVLGWERVTNACGTLIHPCAAPLELGCWDLEILMLHTYIHPLIYKYHPYATSAPCTAAILTFQLTTPILPTSSKHLYDSQAM